jgi:hypothetical protein
MGNLTKLPMSEIVATLEVLEKLGVAPEHLTLIRRDENRASVVAQTMIGGAEPILSRDMRKEGWALLEHAPRRINSVDGFELVPVLKSGEKRIGGEEMLRRSRMELKAIGGQEDAEWLFKYQYQNEIPREWREFCLIFPETVWQGEDGIRRVACLCWDGGCWRLYFFWLKDDWGSYVRVLRLCK